MSATVQTQPDGVSQLHSAEYLVVGGYRKWFAGAPNARSDIGEILRHHYAQALSVRDTEYVLGAFIRFAAALEMNTCCDLAAALDDRATERLVVCLIAGLQHGDNDMVQASLDHLGCPAPCEELIFAAANFALTLRSVRCILIPDLAAMTLNTALPQQSLTRH